MPKRTREQQDAHNERRRVIKQEGRKAITCMKYVYEKYPDIYQEACGFFDMLSERYPRKRDLSRTYEFKQLGHKQESVKKTTMLEPQLEVYLIPNNTTPTTEEIPLTNFDSLENEEIHLIPNNTTPTTEEIPLTNFDSLENEEIQKIISELREDPDLAAVFDDIELPPVSAYTTVQSTTQDEEMLDFDFEALGQDLPDIDW